MAGIFEYWWGLQASAEMAILVEQVFGWSFVLLSIVKQWWPGLPVVWVTRAADVAQSEPWSLRQCQSQFSVSAQDGTSTQKVPYVLHPICQQSPHGCPRNSSNVCLVEHRLSLTLDCGALAASFFYSFFRWLVLWYCGVSVFRKFLKLLSIFALLNCRPVVMSVAFASLSACSFPPTPAWPGQ